MPRPVRIEFEGGLYHVMARGNQRNRIFASPDGGAVKQFGLKGGRREDFTALRRGDLRRVAVAWAVYRRTSLRQSWIADRLGLHSGDNVSAQVRKLSTRASEARSPEIQAWMKAFE